MGYTTTAVRLGEILTDKRLITHQQLQDAIQVQRLRRQEQVASGSLTLGEILIEFGYINRYQLYRGLNWQIYLRKLALLVAFCTPLMTVACGEGELVEDEPAAIQPESNTPKPIPTPQPATTEPPVPVSETPSVLKGPVDLNWTAPALRLSGDLLDITELGGYELRFKLKDDQVYTYIHIEDPWITSHHFDWLEGEYEFQIAAYDSLGTYSDFVKLTQLQD